MTRKTVMHRETEVFVVEEKLAPRKEAIKRRVKLERCIAAGINLGAMILTGGALVKIGLMVFAVMDSRTGGLGGEVLVFPALAMMFLWGREIGLREARQEPVLSGHTTDYSMDGVPVSEAQFKKNLLEIYHDEELAKMLTSYNYFLENMKVADRRKILLQVCGDADFNEVIESQGDLLRELPEMLRKPGKAENR